MDNKRPLLFRVTGTAVVFLAVLLGAEVFISSPAYDVYVQAFKFFTAVVGAGLFWTGSR